MKTWTSGHLKIQDDTLISYSLAEDGETKIDRVFQLIGMAYSQKDKSTLEVQPISDKSYLEHRLEAVESVLFSVYKTYYDKYNMGGK